MKNMVLYICINVLNNKAYILHTQLYITNKNYIIIIQIYNYTNLLK